MTDRRYPRDRNGEPRRRRPLPPARPERRVAHDPLYGEVPLVRVTTGGSVANARESWRYDPDYSPPLPRGAVRGDVRNQNFDPMCHVPRYFYLDERRSCVQCLQPFTFRAQEQKYWYERLRFHFRSIPIRCPACRRKRRSEGALREQIARARAHVREAPSDPGAHLALARAIVEYHIRTDEGDLAAAIAAARTAARLWPEAAEPLYWEGLAHARAGRTQRARDSLAAFLAHPSLREGAFKENARVVMRSL